MDRSYTGAYCVCMRMNKRQMYVDAARGLVGPGGPNGHP